jgi:hypothetical protein
MILRTISCLALIFVAVTVITGCGKKDVAPGNKATPAAVPVAQPAMAAWERGDKSEAIKNFLGADWSARPLFAASSTLSLSESQFKSLSDADRQSRSTEMMSQLDAFKQMSAAVAQAGRDAAAKGDKDKARKCFEALKQSGAALEGPDCLSIVQLVGKSLKKTADAELSKLGQ